jgi:hypothetical protein
MRFTSAITARRPSRLAWASALVNASRAPPLRSASNAAPPARDHTLSRMSERSCSSLTRARVSIT